MKTILKRYRAVQGEPDQVDGPVQVGVACVHSGHLDDDAAHQCQHSRRVSAQASRLPVAQHAIQRHGEQRLRGQFGGRDRLRRARHALSLPQNCLPKAGSFSFHLKESRLFFWTLCKKFKSEKTQVFSSKKTDFRDF